MKYRIILTTNAWGEDCYVIQYKEFLFWHRVKIGHLWGEYGSIDIAMEVIKELARKKNKPVIVKEGEL